MVDVLERPSVAFQEAAAKEPQRRELTLKIDADVIDHLVSEGLDLNENINGLLRFYVENMQRIEAQFEPDGFEPGEMQMPPPAPPAP